LFHAEIKIERKEGPEADSQDEYVAEKAFDKLYQKLEANGEFKGT
jgi:hypothetical protein